MEKDYKNGEIERIVKILRVTANGLRRLPTDIENGDTHEASFVVGLTLSTLHNLADRLESENREL